MVELCSRQKKQFEERDEEISFSSRLRSQKIMYLANNVDSNTVFNDHLKLQSCLSGRITVSSNSLRYLSITCGPLHTRDVDAIDADFLFTLTLIS
jgi:hypothetical protein